MNKRVTVVMITRNRGTQIRTALEHLLSLPEKPPVIVVDNGSRDDTVDIVRTLGNNIGLIVLEHNMGCAGRNLGALQAKTPYIAFSDDDSWWMPGALERAADLFDSHPTLGLIAARILVGSDERLDPLSAFMEHSPLACEPIKVQPKIGIPVVGFAACGGVFRRDAFLEVGGFEQRFGIGGEEHIVALDLLRKGWQLIYVRDIVAYHHPSRVRDPMQRQQSIFRNALWSAWLRRPLPSALELTWHLCKLSLKDKAHQAGLIEAIAGLPWVLSKRNPIPFEIDDHVKITEKAFYTLFVQK